MKRLALGLAIILGLVAAFLLIPRTAQTPQPTVPVTPPTQRLPAAIADAPADAPVVLWVAQATARFEPCGCVAGMHGGLMRRSLLTARLPAARVLSLELGGWSGGARTHEMIRSRFYLRGLATAGIDAVALGETELMLGRSMLSDLMAEAALLRLPLVCANLDGLAGCLPSVVVTAGGRRFLVTAVVPADAVGEGLQVRDPAEALATLAGQAAAQHLDLVCLADLPPDACQALARSVPQVALIIGGRSDHPSPEPVAVGSTRVLWAGNHGKVLGSWAWGQRAAAFELLSDTLPEDPAQRALLGDYQRALAAANLDGESGGGMRALGAAAYSGSDTCTACHSDAQRMHQNSRHHQAFAALERKGYAYDPDCLRCHVTGLGEGGYRRGVTSFAEVGCEACHGPGQAHVRAAQAGRPDDARLPTLSPAACVTCHDPDNSPHFDHGRYWPLIQHALDQRTPTP
jgi:hypothetical protein